jgi:rhodanese-related sulfurtransferase
VAVLDGGLAAWTAAGYPVAAQPVVAGNGDFVATPGGMPLIDAAGATKLAEAGVLLDSRAPERYRGDSEPVDSVAGHIPGARNRPASANVDEQGRFLAADLLTRAFQDLGIDGGVQVGAYCGSGVSAAHQVLALEQRKTAITGDIGLIEGRLDEYRTGLEEVAGSIRAVLDDPASLTPRPELELADTPTGSAFYYTGSNPVVSAADSTPLAPGLGDTAAHETVIAAKEVVDEPHEAVETAPGDPWSPGSWSEVSSALEGSEPIDATLFDDPGTPRRADAFDAPADDFAPADPGSEGVRRSQVDSPTQAYTELGDDRYLRDLDQAVNATEPEDPAMSEFFDGSEGSTTRRFGRRR